MTQHGTSVVIKQTNDGVGSAERWLEMLPVVAGDKKKREKKKYCSGLVELMPTPARPEVTDVYKKTTADVASLT